MCLSIQNGNLWKNDKPKYKGWACLPILGPSIIACYHLVQKPNTGLSPEFNMTVKPNMKCCLLDHGPLRPKR